MPSRRPLQSSTFDRTPRRGLPADADHRCGRAGDRQAVYGEGLRGSRRVCASVGYAPLFMIGTWHEEDEERCMRVWLGAASTASSFSFAGRLDARLKSYAKEVSIVVTGRRLRAPGLFSLQIDDRHGAMLAVRHLLGIGHRKIAFINGSENHPDAIERFEGYKKALQGRREIDFDPKLLVGVGDWHEEGGVRATLELLSTQRPNSPHFSA